MQWHTQSRNITTNVKVKVDFTLLALSTKFFVTWKCHVDESAKGRYNMLLGKYVLTELGLHLKFSEHATKADDRPFKGSTTPMGNLGTYMFKDLNAGKITLA